MDTPQSFINPDGSIGSADQEISQELLDSLAGNFELTDEEKKDGIGKAIANRAMNEINAILGKYGCRLTITKPEIAVILNVGESK